MNTAATIKTHTIEPSANYSCQTWHTFEVTVGRKLYHAEVLVSDLGKKLYPITYNCYRDGGSNQTPRGSQVRRTIEAACNAAATDKVRER